MASRRKHDGEGGTQESPKKRKQLDLRDPAVVKLHQVVAQIFATGLFQPVGLQTLLGKLAENGMHMTSTECGGIKLEEFWIDMVSHLHFGDDDGAIPMVTVFRKQKAEDWQMVNQLAMLLRAARYMVGGGDDHKTIQAAEAEAAKFKSQWENQCRASDVEKAELKERLTRLQDTESQLRRQSIEDDKKHRERIDNLDREVKRLRQAQSDEIERLNKLVFETVKTTHQDKDRLGDQIAQLKAQLKEATTERDQHQDNFAAMLEAHQKELAECEAREAELKKDRDYYFEANKKTQDEYEKALNLTTEAQQMSTKLQKEAKEDSKHIIDMQAQRDEWMSKAQERGDTVKELEKQLEVATEERNHWAAKATHLELKTTKLLEEYDVLHKEKKEIEKLKVLSDVEIDVLNGHLSAKAVVINQLQHDLKYRTDELFDLREDHREALYELNNKYDGLMARYKELEAALEGKLQPEIKMDTNIDHLKKGSIVACTTEDLQDGEAYWLCKVTEVVMSGKNKGNFRGLWYRWDSVDGNYTLLKDNYKVWPTGGWIQRSYFRGILAKLPSSEEAFKRVRV